MKKLLLLALLSLSTLIGYSQTMVGEPAIVIVPAYNTIITLSASPQDSICGGGFSLITISPEADLSTITPSPNGNILAGNFYFNPLFNVPVTYTVHVEGTCGCVFDTIFTQTLDSTQQYGFHLFQIGGIGFYGVSWHDCPDEVNELQSNKITTYPNPVEDVLTVTTPLNSGFVKVYSADGRYILYINFYSPTFNIDTNLINPGTYIIQVYDEHGNWYVEKFIK